ncbi:hypothetical protein JOC61_000209 [Marinitoga litoralis]|nr:hypothetical protein [Marinitoga litoralis]
MIQDYIGGIIMPEFSNPFSVLKSKEKLTKEELIRAI